MIILTKRLGIFCTYDAEGIIDDYVIFLLQDVKKNLAHLAIVCNGKLTPEGKRRLETVTDDVVVRENVGFDMEAWRKGILQKNLSEYDELVLFNNSCYGPLYSFEEVFNKMDTEKPDSDFWGLTVHGQMPDTLNMCPYGYIPEHIQSYFLVIRKKMLHSIEFLEYWQNLQTPENFQEAIRLNEVCFTKVFYDKGFSYDVYCDTREAEKNYNVNIDHTIINTEKLLREYRCPLIKKKVFMTKRSHNLHENYGDEARRSLHYISQNTNYDLNLIWQNILRVQNIALTKDCLSLNYTLSDKFSDFDSQEIFRQTVIIAHLYYEDLMPQCLERLSKVPPGISVIVTVGNEAKKITAENLSKKIGLNAEVRLVSNRGRDMSAFLVGCADVFDKYKYLCFVHDKKSFRENESMAIGNAFFRLLWENIIGNGYFIRNILSTFEEEPQLGILTPPFPYNGGYKFLLFFKKYWSGECYNSTIKLAEELNIPTNFIDIEHFPLAIGNAFWCRTAALKKITEKKWKLEDFPEEPMPTDGTVSHALERILPFAAQSEGFYTGWVMTQEFAGSELENFIYFSMNPYGLSSFRSIAEFEVMEPLISKYLSDLSAKQCFKIFFKMRTPKPLWKFLVFIKNILKKLGFGV